MMGYGYGHGWGMHGFGSFGGGIMMILFWALIIIGIVYLVKNLNSNSKNNRNNGSSNYTEHRSEDNAINIARERYARGEISKEELNEIINDLRRH